MILQKKLYLENKILNTGIICKNFYVRRRFAQLKLSYKIGVNGKIKLCLMRSKYSCSQMRNARFTLDHIFKLS